MSQDVEMDDNDLVFDPDQDPEEKRALRQNYRALTRKVEEQHANPNDFTAADLLHHVHKANALFKKVKEPQEAILDSRLLLMASNVGAQKARSMKSGSGSFDVDEFISKLVTFMGGQNQVRQERYTQDSEHEESVFDTPLDWYKIGRKGLAKSHRAPAMNFMLGPLSIEQKKRAQGKRAKQEKNTNEETRPQELKEEDIQRSENETTKNVNQLAKILEGYERVNLFKFVVNPKDFAQSVENIFYLSFLIRDGQVALETTEDGEPIIFSCEPPSDKDYNQGLRKQQMVLEFDMAVWRVGIGFQSPSTVALIFIQRAIEVFDIKESMIPQRPAAKVKLGQWYG